MSEISDSLLVLGHASSGKSLWAEEEIANSRGAKKYIATARILDPEMRRKVDLHAARRGPDWTLIEAPDDLAAACTGFGAGDSVLIDCATMWLTNRLMDNEDWQTPANAWFSTMQRSPARFVIVSNDVGGGVTPDNAMARQFQRMQGDFNRHLASLTQGVVLVTAGLPQRLK